MRFALLLVAVASWGQTFEVASVKPRNPDSTGRLGCRRGPGSSIPRRLFCVSSPLTELITLAYDVKFYAVEGPNWTNTYDNGFDIEALIPEGTTKAQFQTMLQNLLSERWKLKLHREDRQVQGYSLTAPKPNLKPAGTDSTQGITQEYGQSVRVQVRREAMMAFANFLEVQLQGPVTDDTNLSGEFDFDMEFVPARRVAAGAPGPDLFTELREHLGLALRATKRPLSVLVIDSADRIPTQN